MTEKLNLNSYWIITALASISNYPKLFNLNNIGNISWRKDTMRRPKNLREVDKQS